MSGMHPVAFYGLRVPPNGLRIEANPGLPAAFQITMAAIDPTEEVTTSGDAPPRATLKILRNIFDVVEDESDEDDDDYDSDDIEAIRARLGLLEDEDADSDSDDELDVDLSDEEEEMVNGGPSDPEKARKAQEEALLKALKEDEDAEMEDLPNGINGKVDKGKGRAMDDLSEDGMSEYVVCTLDPTQHYQQTMSITIGENEECYFRNVGSHTIYLTGNFVTHESIGDEEDDEDDLDDMDDELMYGNALDGEIDSEEDDSEVDELDDLADPRIAEVDSDEEEPPKLVKVESTKKNKKKRAAEDDEAKKVVAEEEKPKSKKLKNNAGQAVAGAAPEKETAKEQKKSQTKEEQKPKKDEKKVQFAEKLEQGPTPSKNQKPGSRVVNGVTIEDKKSGTGPNAKKGDKVGMRYIGKLKDGKVFDANKKGKPFEFKVGKGEVIKGWDIGIQGMAVGGERRITVPAKLAYGSKALPGIPANSDLIFDLKMIAIN